MSKQKSAQKLIRGQQKEQSEHAEHWQQAIADAGQLYAESDDKKEQKMLLGAIEWFKHRLRTGASYPGL